MNFRQLQYTLKVAEERSFSKAAQKLYIAQSSLSQYIINLEQELGVQLFDRSTNPLRLTYAGEVYIQAAAHILDQSDQLRQQIEDITNFKKGRIVIGLSTFRTSSLIPLVLPAFRERFPGIEVVLMEGTSAELEKHALQGVTDMTIGPLPVKDELFDYEEILQEELLLSVPLSHPLWKEGWDNPPVIPLARLRDEGFILLTGSQKMHQIATKLCQESGFQPNIVLETKSLEAADALARSGVGIAFIPDTLIRFQPDPKPPCYFSMEGHPSRTLVVSYRKDRYLSRLADAFIETMQAQIQALNGGSARQFLAE